MNFMVNINFVHDNGPCRLYGVPITLSISKYVAGYKWDYINALL